MKTILSIFIGGGLGSVARYLLGSWITKMYPQPFPLGTFTVNVIACFLVGVIASLAGQSDKEDIVRSTLIIGFCGGFSTFSAFTLESTKLFSNNMTPLMGLYIVLSVVVCLVATFVGVWVAR